METGCSPPPDPKWLVVNGSRLAGGAPSITTITSTTTKAQCNIMRTPNRLLRTISPTFIPAKMLFKSICFILLLALFTTHHHPQASSEPVSPSTDRHHHPKECKLDRDTTDYELIKPMVVIGSGREPPQVNESSSKMAAAKPMISLVPLPTADVNCSDVLKIQFSGFGDIFVIDLVKNKRLISDRYFEISKDNINRHGRHPDASSKDSADLNDGEFHKSHVFLDLHNFTTNDDHCHYNGFVNDNLNTISAISIVDHKLLSGFFHDGKDIYYLHPNTTSSVTILTKSQDLCGPKLDHTATTTPTARLKSFITTTASATKTDDDNETDANSSTTTTTTTPMSTTAKRRYPRAAKSRRSSSATTTSSDNYIRHEPFLSNSSSLYVELLVVHDHSQYVEYKGNHTIIAERTMQIVNIMNAFYRQLNIFIALVGVVLWVDKDEIQLTEDGDATLTNFLKYRHEKLLPRYPHDNAQLITSASFNGSVVGKALKGPICTHEHSGGVNTDHSHSPAIVAVTLAHELGHNFGMEHDEEGKCKCPDEKCIMSSSSSAVHPKHWSSCSIDYLEDSRKHGLLDCLINRPEKAFGPVCGNGFVEDGEDCDVGEPIPTFGTSKSRKPATSKCLTRGLDCEPVVSSINPCCDRQTCKFVRNATCAQGPCCDLSTCSVFNATDNRVCRHRQTECDLEEFCDGKGEYCPQDVYYHDGIECGPTASMSTGRKPLLGSASYNRSRAYCYKGKCASHESQCQLLWGPSGSVSRDICYDQNVHGNTSGNCGFNRKQTVYESCEQQDALCGMLHCVHNQPNSGDSRKTGKLNYGFESASILTVSFFVMSFSHTRIYCHGAIIDAGPGVMDPGLVPNGASCGEDRMCLDQMCVPVYDVVYKNWCPSDCNGNGICDNMGVCHCNDGTIGTSCYQFFGPDFHLSLLLYVIMFFIPMIALIVFTIGHYKNNIKIWWFLHNRKIALRAREPHHNQHRSRMPHDVSRNNITISEPIPLNHQNNVNRPFYEPALDPWAETSCEAAAAQPPGKSPGYRLEPLKKQQQQQDNLNSNSNSVPNSQSTDPNSLRPVRAAPPPPPAHHHYDSKGSS